MRPLALVLPLVLLFGVACLSGSEAPGSTDPAEQTPKKKQKAGKTKPGKKAPAEDPSGEEEAGLFKHLPIRNDRVGPFVIGEKPPTSVEKLTLVEQKRQEEAEGETYTVTHVVGKWEGKRPLIDATLDADGTIREIVVNGGGPQTREGMGGNAIIGSVVAIYPDATFHYSYVSDRFWAQSKTAGANLQFLIDPAAFQGDKDSLGKSDLDTLAADAFSYEGKVQRVRVF